MRTMGRSYPLYHIPTGQYRSIINGKEGMRMIYAHERIETWTKFDPELTDRDILPKSERRGLLRRIWNVLD